MFFIVIAISITNFLMISYLLADCIEYVIVNALIPYINILYRIKDNNRYLEIKVTKQISDNNLIENILINSNKDINNRLNSILSPNNRQSNSQISINTLFFDSPEPPEFKYYINPLLHYIDNNHESETDSDMPDLIDIDIPDLIDSYNISDINKEIDNILDEIMRNNDKIISELNDQGFLEHRADLLEEDDTEEDDTEEDNTEEDNTEEDDTEEDTEDEDSCDEDIETNSDIIIIEKVE